MITSDREGWSPAGSGGCSMEGLWAAGGHTALSSKEEILLTPHSIETGPQTEGWSRSATCYCQGISNAMRALYFHCQAASSFNNAE